MPRRLVGARPVAASSGRMSQPFRTREIWCWGPPRQAWASTTIERIRAAVGGGLVMQDQRGGGGDANHGIADPAGVGGPAGSA
jgi:hypothetical protein